MRAPFSLARQHMEFSQFSTFVRSVQFHTCTARCCVLRIGVVSLPANSPGLASLDSIHHRGPLGDSGKHQLRHPKISRSNHQSGLQWRFYSQFHGRYCLLRYWISSGLASWTSTLRHSFVATELVLLVCVRDNLTLNVLMLLCPIEAIKSWQMID